MKVINSVITKNYAKGDGGGIASGKAYAFDPDVTIINSTISANVAIGDGGGIYIQAGDLSITNTTIAGNATPGSGGGVWGSPTLNNSIVALNVANGSGVNIQGSYSGLSNMIGGNPSFVRDPSPGNNGSWGDGDDDPGDLRLTNSSPAIDAGNNSLALNVNGNPLTVDLAGNTRIVNGTVDIGAYEYQALPLAAALAVSTVPNSVISIESYSETPTTELLSADLVDAAIAVHLASRIRPEFRIGSSALFNEDNFDWVSRRAWWSQQPIWQGTNEIGNHSHYSQAKTFGSSPESVGKKQRNSGNGSQLKLNNSRAALPYDSPSPNILVGAKDIW